MAPIIKLAALLSLSLLVAGQGTQFITGPCTSDADCAAGCCGFTSGKCAAAFVANERGEGCGFGNNAPNGGGASNAASIEGNAGNGNAGNGNAGNAGNAATPAGSQFITGPCSSDADCASGCCGFRTGKCAGAVIAQERDGGCGFGDNVPNDNAAQLLTGGGNGAAAPAPAPAKQQGTQFITGPCTSDQDCASDCCGFTTGKCAGPVIAQTRDGGCGFGDAQPNDRAAKAFLGTQRLGRRGAPYWA